LEVARRLEKGTKGHIGSSLEAAPIVHITDSDLLKALDGLKMADICITSDIEITSNAAPGEAFTLDDVSGVSVVNAMAQGNKCARSWRVLPEVGSDPDFPDLSIRDANAMREIEGS
ncbi:MAG: isoleucine--tRNA ligase, partial [Rhizobiaceae bacterium]